jgi:exodeoxyribonuclease-1
MTPLIHVSGMFGATKGNASIVAPVAWHPTNANAVIVVDLSQDISPLFDFSADEIRQRLYTKKDDLGDKLPIPLKLIHINKCPFIAMFKTLLPDNADRLGINRQACLANYDLLKENEAVKGVVESVFEQQKPIDNKGNVDAMLYDGFFSDSDKREFQKIRKSTPEKLANLNLSVKDKRFQDLFFNYRARNFPKTLSGAEQEKWSKYKETQLSPVLSDYFSELDSKRSEFKNDEQKLTLIKDLEDYAKTITQNLT